VLNVLRDNEGPAIIVEQDAPKKPKAPAAGEATEKKPRAPRITRLEQVICPVCGKGHMVKGRTGFGCSEYRNGCPTVFPFTDYPADLTPARLNAQLKKLKK
jgi:DNA topoisomerase-3